MVRGVFQKSFFFFVNPNKGEYNTRKRKKKKKRKVYWWRKGLVKKGPKKVTKG